MTLEHEYALVGGYNRTHVGRWLTIAASSVSALLVFLLLSAIDLARMIGWNVNLPPMVLSLVGASIVYSALYWLFDKHIWKFKPLGLALKIPDLSGKWHCDGEPLNNGAASPWQGQVTIVQSWDRLRVHLETKQSSSDSVAAALIYDAAVGYRLMYHYRNNPREGEAELSSHHGFAELTFPPGENEASGEYFNGRGRYTYGRMKLTKERR